MNRKQYEEYFCWVVRDQGDFRKGPWVGKVSMYAVVLLFRRFESFARLTSGYSHAVNVICLSN